MFVWGLIFALVVAGVLMLMGALLMWTVALLMMIFYPVHFPGEMIKNLFRRDPDAA